MSRPRNNTAHLNAAIRNLTSELVRLVQDAVRANAGKTASTDKASAPAKPGKARRPMSPKLKALRKQQGQFMGLIRSLPKGKREAFKKLREEKGYGAAIAAIRKAGG